MNRYSAMAVISLVKQLGLTIIRLMTCWKVWVLLIAVTRFQEILPGASASVICFQGIEWTQVKHLPASSMTWYTSEDNLRGTFVTGDPAIATAEWSLNFEHSDYDKFIFASGDWSIWLQADKTEVGPGGNYPRSSPRNVINSSSSLTPYTSDWENNGLSHAPIIQLN